MDAHAALQGAKKQPRQRLFCNFCAKSDEESEVLIASHGVWICAACVDLCGEIVQTHRATCAGDAEYASWIESLKTPNV